MVVIRLFRLTTTTDVEYEHLGVFQLLRCGSPPDDFRLSAAQI
jgi:hypothetical protein